MTDSYHAEGERLAFELGNRGPVEFEADGRLRDGILDAYWRTGF